MRWMFLMIGGGVLVLAVFSVVIPPVPVWVGGLIGIAVFIVWGNLLSRFVE
jgi:putative flippase GtrA